VGVVNIIQRALWSGVAVDLGTVNTLVYMEGRGIVLDQPSVLAVRRTTGELVAVGKSAAAVFGRAPEDVKVIKPLHDGVISDPDACSLMLQGFLRQVCRRHRLGRPEALVCVPGCATEVERRALVRAISDGRPHFQVTLVEETVAAALGAAADLSNGNAVLIVDIGGGTTEMGVVVGGGLARSRSIRVGGNQMDAAIMQAVRTQLGLVIGERTAERVKMTLGLTGDDLDSVLVSGVDPAKWGHLCTVEVPAALVKKALDRYVSAILSNLSDLLAELPPDLVEEVLDQGVLLAGGGALLHGVAASVSERAGCKATVVDDPLRCVLRGLAMILDPGTQRSRAA
jgi:rod shape-determining protein MreB and related proteins